MEKLRFSLMVNVNAEMDVKTQEVTIISCTPVVVTNKTAKSEMREHVLTRTEHRYKIFTLGAGFARKYGMGKGEQISIYIDGKKYPHLLKTHHSIAGRIDGLTQLNNCFGVFMEDFERGTQRVVIGVCYDAIKKRLDVETSRRSIYIPAEAVKRVRNRRQENAPFCLSSLYSDCEWRKMPQGVAGVLGKNFYTYVKENCSDIIPVEGSFFPVQYVYNPDNSIGF